MEEKMILISLDNLKEYHSEYHSLITSYVDEGDAKSLKTVALDGKVLKFYNVAEPVGETAPVYEITLPETDLTAINEAISELNTDVAANTSAIAAINDETNGILAQAKAYADGKDDAIQAAKDAGDAAQADVDALEGKVGAVEDGKTVMGIIAEIQESAYDDTEIRGEISAINDKIGEVAENKTVVQMIADAQAAATYDDEEVRGLIADNAEAIEAHKTAIDSTVATLVGEDTGKSVRTIANEELAAQLLSGDAEADFKTLQELAAWLEDHPEDAAAMNKSIEDLQKLVGTLPEGATSTDIVAYIAEVVAAEKARAEGVEGGLDERLEAVEGLLGTGEGSVDEKIATAKQEAIDAAATDASTKDAQVLVDAKAYADGLAKNYDEAGAATTAEGNAKTYADGLNTAMDTRVAELEGLVGEGYEVATSEQIKAIFA